MKKILMALMTIAITIGLASGAAYALFSDTATVSGIAIGSGNADLMISAMNATTGFDDDLVFPSEFNTALSNLYPGFEDRAEIWLRNDSASHILLDINGRLTSASGDWGALKDVIQIRVQADDLSGPVTSWKTLAEWNATGGVHFPGDDIGQNEVKKYWVYLRVPSSATNSIADKSMSDVTFVLTATQVNYPN